MIPAFNKDGEQLPAGEFQTSLKEIEKRFGQANAKRRSLMNGLTSAALNFVEAGVKRIWIDGSFVTSKGEPNDIDGCWEYTPEVVLEKLDQVFLTRSRAPMKEKYGLEFFPAHITEGASGLPFPKFFQINRNKEPKGVLFVDLGGGK